MSAADLAAATGDYAAAGLPQPMTPARFRELRAATGLSFRDLAAAIGMRGKHAATHLREMADGVRSIPGPTGIALMALADGWTPGRTYAIAADAADALDDLLIAMNGLIAESEGVAGLHLNGDVAPWSDLLSGGRFEEWLGTAFDRAGKARDADLWA